MTEAEWLACSDVGELFHEFPEGKTNRKCILFATACCVASPPSGRRKKHTKKQIAMWRAAEQFADGEISVSALREIWGTEPGEGWPEKASQWAGISAIQFGDKADLRLREVILAILRDILGNPFRPVAFDPSWRTPTVEALARGAYDERAFDRLPILADALQDAGCDSDELLSHLRDPHATHVRGCWALDLVLGKE